MQLKKSLLTLCVVTSALLMPTLVYGQAYGKVNVDTLNMREQPNVAATNIGQLDKKDEVDIVGRANDEWLEIQTSNGKKAYIFAEFVSIEEAQGTITGQGVRLRDYPAVTNSTVLNTLSKGEEVVIEYTVDGWCKVIYDGKEGFVSQEFVDSKFMKEIKTKNLSEVKRIDPNQGVKETTHTSKKNESSNTGSQEQASSKPVATGNNLGEAIVEDAKQFVGNPYVYGGNSLTNGVDCSGFTQQIMKRHGISISRTSRSQYANDGYKVSRDELQKGDLVFYGYNGSVSHVAIYIGGGKIVHANTSSTGIIISSLDGSGKPYIGAKRVI